MSSDSIITVLPSPIIYMLQNCLAWFLSIHWLPPILNFIWCLFLASFWLRGYVSVHGAKTEFICKGIILFSSDKLTHQGSMIWESYPLFLAILQGLSIRIWVLRTFVSFWFSENLFKVEPVSIYVEDANSKFFGLSCWVLLGLGKQTWLGICHLQIYTVTFSITVDGQV